MAFKPHLTREIDYLVYLDTEYTDLKEPYLISIGLVATDGRETYCEMAGISPEMCSPFVCENVLPLLQGPVVSPIQIAEAISAFLQPFGGAVTFFCDAPRYDIELIKPFLPQNLEWTVAVPSFETEDQALAYRMASEKAFADGLRRHHALDDARALYRAWQPFLDTGYRKI